MLQLDLNYRDGYSLMRASLDHMEGGG